LEKGEAIMVLGEWPFYANIPVKDLQEAKRFYENTLGANPVREEEDYLQYQTGDSLFGLYPNQEAAGSALHTLGSFMVEDIEATVTVLRSRGIDFEEYDMPGLKTENGIAQIGPEQVAFFKDPDGNILSVVEVEDNVLL
jgi:catechol 2,3-dioxygenase-like lactoylglutathione lyase family enzyme